MHSRAIAVSTLWQIGSQAVMAVLSAIAVKFVAIGLSVELAGTYNSAYGFLQIFAILADFGLYAVSINELSKTEQKERVLGALITIRIALTILSLGCAVAIGWVVPAWQGTPLPIGITIVSFVPFLTLLSGVLRTIFQVTYSMHIVFVAEVMQRVVTVGLMAVIIAHGVRGSDDESIYQLFLWLGVLGSLTLFVLSFIFAIKKMRVYPSFVWADIRPLLMLALPYGAVFFCIALYRQFDLTMIAFLRDDFQEQNARYGFALRIAEMTYLVPTFLLNSALPLLSAKRERGEDVSGLIRKTLLILLLLGSFASIFAALWARPLMHLFTDDVYLTDGSTVGADTALLFLSPSMFLNTLILFSFYVLLSAHLWKRMLFPMTLAAVLSLALNFILIPKAGFVGATFTLFIVHILLCLVLLPTALRSFSNSFSRHDFLLWILFSAGVAIIAYLLLPFLVSPMTTILGGITALFFTGCLLLGLQLRKALS